MDDWISRYAEALSTDLDGELQLDSDDERAILGLARVVAHGTERKNAPLTTFLVGRYCALRQQRGATREESLAEATEIAERLLGELGEES